MYRLLRRRRPRANTGVFEKVQAVELNLDVLDIEQVLLLHVRRFEDGDTANRKGSAAGDLGEGGGPDNGDLVAVPGADLDDGQGGCQAGRDC